MPHPLIRHSKIWLCFLFFSLFLNISSASARELTSLELKFIENQARSTFVQFLQLWKEERFFEMYEFGKIRSKEQLSLEEYATRMVELDWIPEGLAKDTPIEVNFHFRTMLYLNVSITFRHKNSPELQFTKQQPFLLIWEKDQWRFDLLQLIRSPFYTPPESRKPLQQQAPAAPLQ